MEHHRVRLHLSKDPQNEAGIGADHDRIVHMDCLRSTMEDEDTRKMIRLFGLRIDELGACSFELHPL